MFVKSVSTGCRTAMVAWKAGVDGGSVRGWANSLSGHPIDECLFLALRPGARSHLVSAAGDACRGDAGRRPVVPLSGLRSAGCSDELWLWWSRTSIRGGFRTWEYLLGWASWGQFLAIVCILLLAGIFAGGWFPPFKFPCGAALMTMGSSACFAYMFIDLERNEVERGYKSIHNPLKGQMPAENLKRYGKQVRIPLLIAATVAAHWRLRPAQSSGSMRPWGEAGTASPRRPGSRTSPIFWHFRSRESWG